ncbi:signal transduction histidine kinase [Desulfosporosinus acidiphilus SJ4]|uniref:histidine kinase n=1 Tax=Desulfosporosinus acidiphilus (strain DSM 22704 / JCM 16185 / SJ4) TaxID=646529 RepID=I4D6A9_DESAJ|nr:ATP-binding protein [Desulfosporosinus acidiphilus]AFM41333.1 signal transduction histidine kinase [Desulfosporosinus acidiphilus SJ4]
MIKNKIVIKLTISLVLIVTICMIAIGVLFMQLFKQYAFASREKAMLTSARSVASVAAEVIGDSKDKSIGPNNPLRGYGAYLRSLDIITDSQVWITDNTGLPVVISGNIPGQGMGQGRGFGYGARQGNNKGSGLGQGFLTNTEPLPQEAENVIRNVLKGQESISESFSSIYREATITIGVPIFDDHNLVIGTVLLHTPVTGITSVLNKATGILGVSLLGAFLLAVALGVFYSILFTRPLKAMNQTAVEITNGNYNARTGVERSDEVGQLGKSLDLMAQELGLTIDELFQEKQKLNDILSSISEGIAAFNYNFEPVSTNAALAGILNRILPYSVEDVDKDFKALGIKPEIAQVFEKKQTIQILKNWSDKILQFTISPIVDKQDAVTGCVALVHDISESERLEQLRRDFVANVSHEFRTPLTVIRGYLEAINDGNIETWEDIQNVHRKILSETHSLERLVKDLLELSYLQSGKAAIHRECIHFTSLLSDTLKSLQSLADTKTIKLAYSIKEEVPPFLGDYDRLRQLMIIFLDNAITHSPNNTSIFVEISLLAKQELIIIIDDEGYGITADQLPHIWERFYKGDGSRTSKGTGLGLAIAKALIDLQNGRIEIQSEPKKGTRITICLPIELPSDFNVD